MNFKSRTVVIYSMVLGKDGSDHLETVHKDVHLIPGEFAFPIIGRLIYSSRHLDISSLKLEMDVWVGKGSINSQKYTELIHKSYKAHIDKNKLMVINLWSSYKLLELILEENVHKSQSDEITANTGEELLNIYLRLNEIFIAKTEKVWDSIPSDLPIFQRIAFHLTTSIIPYHDFTHVDTIVLLFVQFIKASYLFRFMEEALPIVLKAFLNKYHQDTWQMYLRAMMPVADHAMRAKGEGVGYLTIDENKPNANILKAFLNNLSVGDSLTYDIQQDFVLLRSKPLMKINDTKFLVMDSVLVYNKFYNSLYFEFNKIIEESPSLFTKANFKGWYNENFSEAFLCNELLNYIFNKHQYIKWPGIKVKKEYSKSKGEPDYYSRTGNNILLFELKDSLIKGNTKQSFDYKEVEKELREKFWYYDYIDEKGKSKVNSKAVRQLKNSVKSILSKSFMFDQEYESNDLIIYPILLFLDRSLDTPGVNDILNHWFQIELANDSFIVQSKATIMPLTTIDFDTLVQYQDVLSDNDLILEKLIPTYWNWKQHFIEKGTYKHSAEIVGKGMISFSAFLKENFPLNKEPKVFLEIAKKLF